MDRGAWQGIVQGVAKELDGLSNETATKPKDPLDGSWQISESSLSHGFSVPVWTESGVPGLCQTLQDLLRAEICASHSGYRDRGVTVVVGNTARDGLSSTHHSCYRRHEHRELN